jgi:uroporphyrinogen decarboxylase
MRISDQVFADMTASLDVDQFWAENAQCQAFSPDKPRCPVSFSPDDHWLFEFLQVPSTVRYYSDKTYRDELHRQANEITRASVGMTFFDEDTWCFQPKRIEQLFGCELSIKEGGTPWLLPATDDPQEFEALRLHYCGCTTFRT